MEERQECGKEHSERRQASTGWEARRRRRQVRPRLDEIRRWRGAREGHTTGARVRPSAPYAQDSTHGPPAWNRGPARVGIPPTRATQRRPICPQGDYWGVGTVNSAKREGIPEGPRAEPRHRRGAWRRRGQTPVRVLPANGIRGAIHAPATLSRTGSRRPEQPNSPVGPPPALTPIGEPDRKDAPRAPASR